MKIRMLVLILYFVIINITHASTPLWTFKPLTPTTVTLSRFEVAEVQYLVTNQSNREHYLDIQPFPFTIVTASPFNCGKNFLLGPKKSCLLDILIDVASRQDSYREGPVYCEYGSQLLCYTPSEQDILTVIYTH